MRQTGLSVALWAIFALAILTGGYAMLRACDLEHLPLFGYTSCEAPARIPDLAAEREREADLRSKIHAAEIRLALLPVCTRPLAPRPSDPKPPKQDDQQVVQKFEVPKKLEDLKGCWQSSRGDIEIVSDDAEQKHLGAARFCYCFKGKGQGTVQISFTDGDICRANLTARISPDHVSMHHGNVACQKHDPYIASDITCSNDQSNETVCERQNLGQIKTKTTERFIRVTNEYCGWSG
jgi:hypothetical protein